MGLGMGVGEMGKENMGVRGGDGEGEHGGEGWVSENVKHRNGHRGDGKENMGIGGIEKGNMGGYDEYGKEG